MTAFAGVRPPLLARPPRAFGDVGAGKIALSYKHVSAGYFDVLGIPIVRGRAFTTAESDEHPVAVVSESAAGRCGRMAMASARHSGSSRISPPSRVDALPHHQSRGRRRRRAVDAAHGHGRSASRKTSPVFVSPM